MTWTRWRDVYKRQALRDEMTDYTRYDNSISYGNGLTYRLDYTCLSYTSGGLVVQVLEQHIFQGDGGGQALPQPVLVEQVADLDADLGVFVRVEGGDAALGGAKGLAAQALLLVAVLETVVGHQDLGPLRDDQVGGGEDVYKRQKYRSASSL